MDLLTHALQSGIASLAAYLAAHVLLCLVPAFLLPAACLPRTQQSIIRYLGPATSKYVAYPAAARAGSLLAVCSCTVQPLFAGIYSKGAGLGPAITFLFFAPAANILALSYTGVALGADFAIARIGLALCFGIGIGLLMALIFRQGEEKRTAANGATFAGSEPISRQTLIFLATLVALLIAGTLKVDLLNTTLLTTSLPWAEAVGAQAWLDRLVPVNEIKGQEGLSLQGLTLIVLLLAIGATAWRGLGKVDEGFNRATWLALGLTAATLVFAALGIKAEGTGLTLAVTGRTLAVAMLCATIPPLARRFDPWDMQQWLWETWRFIKMIFPLLIVGVFLVGIIRSFIQPAWIQYVAGSNTFLANLAGVVFGVFMYFPTLVEVPIAKMFLSLGMHPGPLIAYLMADPELSLQSILITSAIIGKLRAWTYVALVALFSILAGLTYGAWVDGTSGLILTLAVGGFILLLMGVLNRIEYRNRRLSN